MSSINFSGLISLTRVGSLVTGVAGTVLKGTMFGPAGTILSGGVALGRWLVHSTFGRIAVVSVVLLCGFFYLKAHFASIEAAKWTAAVQQKQTAINNKVVEVNTYTKRAQDLASSERGFLDRILAVVVDGISRVQPPHPIEEETIDLINETRGKQ